MIDAKAPERAITGSTHIFRSAVYAHKGAILAPLVAELRREHNLIPPALDRLADEQLIRERAVHIGRVQKVHPKFQGAVNRGDRLAFIRSSVELGHSHTAKAYRRNDEPLASKCSLLHLFPSYLPFILYIIPVQEEDDGIFLPQRPPRAQRAAWTRMTLLARQPCRSGMVFLLLLRVSIERGQRSVITQKWHCAVLNNTRYLAK